MTTQAPLVQVEQLNKRFPVSRDWLGRPKEEVHAVRGLSLDLQGNETLGLVGESGCGKSTLGRLILRLLHPDSGRIVFDQKDITHLPQKSLKFLRREAQLVFQDPYSSLNPRMTVFASVSEPLIVHDLARGKSAVRDRVVALLEQVGMQAEHLDRYPHEFSGGQRQRIGIARALAVDPRLIVADEAVSALDVSIQAQILNLLMDLQQAREVAYLFIAHDLRVVQHISHRVAVMYLGGVVELSPTERLYEMPMHPYTQALLQAIPEPEPAKVRHSVPLLGDVPSPLAPPPGCSFHPRCPLAEKGLCDRVEPELRELESNHFVACHKAEEASGR